MAIADLFHGYLKRRDGASPDLFTSLCPDGCQTLDLTLPDLPRLTRLNCQLLTARSLSKLI